MSNAKKPEEGSLTNFSNSFPPSITVFLNSGKVFPISEKGMSNFSILSFFETPAAITEVGFPVSLETFFNPPSFKAFTTLALNLAPSLPSIMPPRLSSSSNSTPSSLASFCKRFLSISAFAPLPATALAKPSLASLLMVSISLLFFLTSFFQATVADSNFLNRLSNKIISCSVKNS